MKVTSIEKKEYEVVEIDGVKYHRYNKDDWSYSNGGLFEKAYQRYKNPPFKIRYDEMSSCQSKIILTIGNFNIYSCNILTSIIGDIGLQLEQALNSLIERGE